MTTDNEKQLNELAKLREKFAKSLDGRIEEIASLSQKISDNPNQREASLLQTSLRSSAHKLSGSAGSYGFPEVSRICKQIDIFTQGCEELIDRSSKERLDTLKCLVAQLKKIRKFSQ